MPTAGTTDEPTEKRLRGERTVALLQERPRLSGIELSQRHQRLVRLFLNDLAASRLAKVDLVLDHSGDADFRPIPVAARRVDAVRFQEDGELRPRGAGRTPPEALRNNRRRRLVPKQAAVPIARVARRRPSRDVNAASDRLSDGDLPIALDPLQLEPGDEHEDSDREPAHRCRAVELSSTETNRAFASVSRRIEVSASTAERANLSRRATTIPPVSPRSQRASACWNIGRSSFAPDWSISSHH